MKIEENTDRMKMRRARKRVQELKGFYRHLMVYLTINTVIIIVKIAGNSNYGDTFMGPFWHFSTFATPLFWGIGLGFHAMKVFSPNWVFGHKWEERQIQKYIEQEKKEAEKFR